MADKKGIKEWVKDMENNEGLRVKFEGKESSEEIVALAKEEGYEFTVDEFMDLQMEMVSGGGKVGDWFKKTFSKKNLKKFGRTIGGVLEDFGDILG